MCKVVSNNEKVHFKDLKIFARPKLGERWVVDVYNYYFGFVPKTRPFYWQPIGDDPPKFSKQVVGKNRAWEVGKRNVWSRWIFWPLYQPSRKVTCVIELFVHNVDEQLILWQTGHRSSTVREYKKPRVAHDMLVSAMLQPPSKSSWTMSSVSFHPYQNVSLWGSVRSSFLEMWTLYWSVRCGTCPSIE